MLSQLLIGFVIGAVLFGFGVYWWLGSRRSHSAPTTRSELKRLEEYPFYPFVVNDDGHVEFSAEAFCQAVDHFMGEANERAARELIVIGEQNLVRERFATEDLNAYKRLYEMYDGDQVVLDNDAFLENYRRIVSQLGRSFRGTGIEILLHNLVNPSRSLVAIENGEVTGRTVGSGATNLVLDLKTRRQRGEDKVNYELNIGSRQFKCTTIPVFREDFGLVGAVCINVDTHFIREAVVGDEARLVAFVDNLLRTDFELDENILSPEEFQSALRGKRHYMDEAIRSGSGQGRERRLAAILFSDIVDFTSRMAGDENATMRLMEVNDDIHHRSLAAHGGQLLKKLGDGTLARFDSASEAVSAARDMQRSVAADGSYQLRVGIHLGEVVVEAHDVHGDGVNIASRIQDAVEPGQIGFSSVVFDNIKNKEGFEAKSIGQHELKNVSDPVSLYVLVV